MLVSEPVRGRSRATELPCYKLVLYQGLLCCLQKNGSVEVCPGYHPHSDRGDRVSGNKNVDIIVPNYFIQSI